MIELTRSVGDSEPETVALFAIDGKEYRVPAKPRVNVALQYLTFARDHGAQMANMMLLEQLLGPEGYKALSEFEDLTTAQLQQVAEEASKLTLGALESEGND